MNIFKNIVYLLLKNKERKLESKLKKDLRTSASTKTSKTVLGENVTMTFSAETEKNKELVLKSVTELVNETKAKPELLIEFIKAHKTRVIKLPKADKILALIKEEEGLICEKQGFEALFINLLVDGKISFKSNPIIILNEAGTDAYTVLHQFYKWFSLFQGLPGFDVKSQKLFKKYLNAPDNINFNKLSLEEMTGLKEAIARDQEATSFTLDFAKLIEGSKKVLEKIENEGGANI